MEMNGEVSKFCNRGGATFRCQRACCPLSYYLRYTSAKLQGDFDACMVSYLSHVAIFCEKIMSTLPPECL